MASYASYRKIKSDQIIDGAITDSQVQAGATFQVGEQWVYSARGMACHACANNGSCCCMQCGRCCQWTVPDKVARVTFEIWSGGGSGGGISCCNCCSFSQGGAGGNYAIRSVDTAPGCQYRVCAGGTYRCNRRYECNGSIGCSSFVQGYNLSNFCTVGACRGWSCNGDAWGPRTYNSGCANSCICSYFGADFGMSGVPGYKMGTSICRCHGQTNITGSAPLMGVKFGTTVTEAWCTCGCYSVMWAGGGQGGLSTYCETAEKCCAAGGPAGAGVVRITFG